MRAVIMAGGEGSRLRPLTCDTPKPMVRLCGRPILEYILDLLAENGFTEAFLTLRYLPQVITGHFPDGQYRGIKLHFVQEEQALGTAGGVKNACPESEEPILVISGDAMCDFDLASAMAFHRQHSRAVTILVKKVDDPREYGLVDCQADGQITGFLEKPDYTQAVSDLANTGVYILSPKTLQEIPAGKNYDFSKDLFPTLMARGEPLMALEEEGYWCDIGDLGSYVRAQRDILEHRVNCRPAGEWDSAGNCLAQPNSLRPQFTVQPPIYLGRDVRIEDGAVLEAGTVIDNGSQVGRSRLTGAVLLADSYVGRDCGLTGPILCSGASVKDGAMIFEGAAIGTGAVVGERATVSPGVKIWPGKVVEPATVVRSHVKYGSLAGGLFDEDGIAGTAGVEITPEYCARVGAALGSLGLSGAVALGQGGSLAGEALAAALCSGLCSTGREVLDFGRCPMSVFTHLTRAYPACLGVYLQCGQRVCIRLIDADGLSVSRTLERSVEGTLSRGEFTRAGANRFGRRIPQAGYESLYLADAQQLAPQGLVGMSVQLKSSNPQVEGLARTVLERMGCETHRGICMQISGDGRSLTIHGRDCGYLSADRVLALCCISAFEKGEDVALPFDAPRVFDTLAGESGRRLFRYLRCPADSSDRVARQLAARQHWTRDGIWQAVMILELLHRRGQTVTTLMALLPTYGLAMGRLNTRGNPAGLLRSFHAAQNAITEGVVIQGERGTVLLQPSKRGNAVKILAEAMSCELASELCEEFLHQLTTRQEQDGEAF